MGFNGDAKVVSLISSGNDHGQVRITGLDALLTDIEIRVSSSQTGSIATGSFSLLLVKNGTFN